MPFLLVEILNFQGSIHHIGVGSFRIKYIILPIKRQSLEKMLRKSFLQKIITNGQL